MPNFRVYYYESSICPGGYQDFVDVNAQSERVARKIGIDLAYERHPENHGLGVWKIEEVSMPTKRRISACGLIFNRNLDILLGLKIKFNQWEMPGGKADDDEPIQTTAYREVSEETGLLVPKMDYLGYYDKDPKWLCHVFTGRSDDKPQNPEPDKHSTWVWVPDPFSMDLTDVCHGALKQYYGWAKIIHDESKRLHF